ncbi:hypothetical protein ACLF3G_26245 [Falsiroseomonas sp. HC035]|uniref:hypothetical protein n=1 Tax=Falsiroseomonas sp. HC035 TaxID=3390999 RepID=UPI003D3187FC
MTIRGSIDNLTSSGANGWIFGGRSGTPLVVQALVSGKIVGEAIADEHRSDLEAAGLGDGRCGFTMSFYEQLDPIFLPMVQIKPQGSDLDLPRTNLTGFTEFFQAIHARYPGAGRTRSVLGGLWVDRNDAASVLVGRISSGATPANLGVPLGQIILNGMLLLPDIGPSAGLFGAEAATEVPTGVALHPKLGTASETMLNQVPGIMFRDPLLPILRAVLDDNPLVYRVVMQDGGDSAFTQPSATDALPSPGECMLAVSAVGGTVLVDVVRNSNNFPEFTKDGRSRWLAGGGASIDIAAAQAASIQTIPLSPSDVLLIGAGTIYRVRSATHEARAMLMWVAPARQTPVRFLLGQGGTFTTKHFTGAALSV